MKAHENILKILAGALLAFIVAEAAVRLLGFPSVNTNTFDAKGFVVFKPNQSFLVKDRCYASVVESNSAGFHSKEYSLEKPAGTYRIALLGDSFVEAVQVPLEKSFPYILEQKLNARLMTGAGGRKYEVIPIGKSGNGTLMNIAYAREYALRYHPDLIVDAFITNDLQDDFAPGAGQPKPPTGSPFELSVKHFILERSLLFERWWMNLKVVESQMRAGHAKDPSIPSDSPVASKSNLESFVLAQLEPQTKLAKDMWANEEKALRAMKAFAAEHGAKFLLVQLAEGYLIDPPQLMTRYDATEDEATRFNQDLARQKLAAIAARNGFAFFSTQPYFARVYQDAGVSPVLSCDNHYNELGNEQAADAIYGFLKDSIDRL